MIVTDGKPTIAWANPPEDDEHHGPCTSACGRTVDLAELKRLEVRNRTWEAVDTLNSGALAGLIAEANGAVAGDLSGVDAIRIARYLLGVKP